VKRYLVDEGVDPDRIFVAEHATNNEFYRQALPESKKAELRRRLRIRPNQKVVLYLGRLEVSKGVSFLIDAFAQLNAPDVVLVIAGSGNLRRELEGLANKMQKKDQIRFVGYVPIEDAPLYYSLAWTFVLPSITVPTGNEPWGLVVNEAFNQGVPVITTDAVGAASGGLVQDGVNGFIVPEQNGIALREALERLIADLELHELFGENAKKIVANWNYERNVLGYQRAIEHVTKR
jgi:glycosyltransferase involved in cell wall biosynthesis